MAEKAIQSETGTEQLTTEDLPSRHAGIVKSHSSKWHVFRNGKAFSCAKGDSGLFEDAPLAEIESLETESYHTATKSVKEALQERLSNRETVCLHCADCYGILQESDA